jgi:glycosyltransferase involved in cell wall biosynthesis
MLKAFDMFKKEESSPLKFIIAGSKRWWTSEMETTYQALQHKQDVIFTSRVSDTDLYLLTGDAFAAVYTSSFEGFGIPLVEAMNCNVPVITSNVTAMPEIGGEAALLVDPFSIQSIANGMRTIWKDETLRNSLIEKGKVQRQKFSWDKTASLLWNCVEKVL